jgi:hypothetical protein
MSDPLDERLAPLLRGDLETADLDDIAQAVWAATCGLRFQAPQFAAGLLLFRARATDSVTRVADLSYPPPTIAPLGRANRAGSPRFYAATFRNAVFFELLLNPGSTVFVSRWRTTSPALLHPVGYSSEVSARFGSSRDPPAYGLQPHDEPITKALRQRLSELFTQPVLEGGGVTYKLSAAIAECLAAEPFAGVIYPTVAMAANADNLALNASWADRHLLFLGVERIVVREVGDGTRQVEIVDYATAAPDGAALEWKGRGPIWVLREQGSQLTLKSRGDIWIAQDVDEHEVDPE